MDTSKSVSQSLFRNFVNRLVGFGRWLIEPSRKITDLAQRRRASLLSIFMISLFALFLGINLVYLFTIPGYTLPVADLIGYGFLLLIYILSRTHLLSIATLLLLIMFPMNVFQNILGGTSISIMGTLMYLIPSFILASIFTNLWTTILYGCVINLITLLLPTINPTVVPGVADVYVNVAVNVIVVTLCVIWVLHRNQIERDRTMEIKGAYSSTLLGWSRAMELRDGETEGHCLRVTELAMNLGRALGLHSKELETLQRGSLLHDIGKMGIPDSILLKPSALDENEWKVMHTHPKVACELLGEIAFLKPAMVIPAYHHEWWNGQGYPDQLSGEQIPLIARIFAVIDVWDALLSDRPYRKAWPREQVVQYLKEQSGKQFDPRIVDSFLALNN